ncbi:hypothetical protein FQA39_LY04889 [Lamprigera yunnana]|nr:hypothetical protein FQA39_LY04889 [Lamprigera yunnana]
MERPTSALLKWPGGAAHELQTALKVQLLGEESTKEDFVSNSEDEDWFPLPDELPEEISDNEEIVENRDDEVEERNDDIEEIEEYLGNRMNETIWPKRLFAWKPLGKNKRGRPRRSWNDKIRKTIRNRDLEEDTYLGNTLFRHN